MAALGGVLPDWLIAFGGSGLLALAAYLRRSLSADGAFAACWVGGTLAMGFGAAGFVVLCTFFFTSSLLGRVGRRKKRRFETHYAKGHTRDAWQVMANGGVASACAAWLWLQGMTGDVGAWEMGLASTPGIAACASLASANADTWATELGVLSSRQPWHVLSWKQVPAGTSGAVSGWGLTVAALGASVIGLTAWVFGSGISREMVLWIATAGFVGAGLDSFLGALVQRQYVCRVCNEQVETPLHCAARARRIGPKWAVFNNDAVNFTANFAAALLVAVVQ